MTQPTTGDPVENPVLLEPFLAFFRLAGLMLGWGQALAAGDLELWRQKSLYNLRPTNLSPGDAATALRRGFIDDAEAENVLQRHGYSERAVKVFRDLVNTEFQAGEHLDLWRRDKITDAELDIRLESLGYNEWQIRELKIIAFAVPTPSDVVRFAVREVYAPELREQLGLDKEFPPEAVNAFRRSGLDPETAGDYWAAHWNLPAVGHAFEMYHREQITREQLELLLRANDYLPTFREAYVNIAYNPITRVDVRRLHALGIIDDDDLERRYRHIGYSPEDAKLLAEFTKRYNDDDEPEQSAEVRELTRAQIERFYEEGLFSREDIQTGLESLGYTAANSETIILLAELRKEQRAQDMQIDVVKRQFANETIDYNTAVTRLDEIGIPALKRDLLLAQFETERLSQVRLPTRSELDRMVKAGLVGRDEYIEQLRGIGYSDVWAERFYQLIPLSAGESE